MKLFLVWAGLVIFFSFLGILGGIVADNNFGRGVVLSGIFFGVVFATIIFICSITLVKADKKTWNDGVCPTCGQVWEFKCVAAGYKNYRTYYYECDNCHSVIAQHILK